MPREQTSIFDFLASSATHGGSTVERIDTHASVVFLAGARAYKVKRAVAFDYLDFSTLERRKLLCEAEVRLNRRTAPSIYRRVVPVTRGSDGSFALDGSGTVVEWLVEMNRFDQEQLFDRLAAANRLDIGLMVPLASAIAALHGVAEHRKDRGGRAGMAWVIEGNAAGLAEYGKTCLDPSCCGRVTADARRELERRASLLDARRASGFVRQCHGDLHLRNIVQLDGQPTLFDGVEFNDEISCTDVFYDLAFLLMDLWHRRLAAHANVVLNRYLVDTEDYGGLTLLPLFLSCRAAVRAKTSATAASQADGRRRSGLCRAAREYLDAAEQLLHPARPLLIAVGGFSGSGKSTLALGLAPSAGAVPGAVVLRSDEIRKWLCGVAPVERLGAHGYASDVTERVYATIGERARRILRGGQSVIADAVYARQLDRQAIEQVARDVSVPFFGMWLDAGESMLIDRVERRRGDPSDADVDVIRVQSAQKTGPIDWHRLDASVSSDTVLTRAMSRLRDECPDVVSNEA